MEINRIICNHKYLLGKHLLDELLELLVGKGVVQLGERVSQASLVPFVVRSVLRVKAVP